MASPLVLDFNNQNYKKAHSSLVESGQNFLTSMNRNIVNNNSDTIDVLDTLYCLKYKPLWSDIKKTLFTYSITCNMDPSKVTYSEKVEDQLPSVIRVIKNQIQYIKNICVIYEYGDDNNKLHWHILVSLDNNIKDFRDLLQKEFGTTKYAVEIRRINPNNGETMIQNNKRLLKYYKKQKHNNEHCLLGMTPRSYKQSIRYINKKQERQDEKENEIKNNERKYSYLTNNMYQKV